MAAQGVATLDGLGPVSLDDCSRQERVVLSTLGPRTLLLAGLILIWLIIARVRHDLIEPLSSLRNWSLRMRGGNLSARLPVPESGEFRELTRPARARSTRLSRCWRTSGTSGRR